MRKKDGASRDPEIRDEKEHKISMAPNNMAEVQEQEGKRSEGGPCAMHRQTPEAATWVPSFVFLSCGVIHLSHSSLLSWHPYNLSKSLVSIGSVISRQREAVQQYGNAFWRQKKIFKKIPYQWHLLERYEDLPSPESFIKEWWNPTWLPALWLNGL